MLISAGSSSTTNMAGKIRSTSGKTILIGAFCARSSAAALRRLRISSDEVPHHLADRDAERLALDDRANEHAHARGVRARVRFSSVCEVERPMFCSCRVSRISSPSGPAISLGGEPHRAGEADAGLDRDDQQVDQLRQLVVDLLAPALHVCCLT